MAGYTYSTPVFIDGAVIQASLFNTEFANVSGAFHQTNGHNHSGAAGSGANIPAEYISYSNATSELSATDVSQALNEIDSNLDDLVTLSGVNLNATHLGTFTGTTITDSSTVKAALQLIETAHEAHTANTTTAHGVTGAVVGTTNTQTLTNKTINMASNTITGTLSQFNTALSDADFASLAGSETLTNKTIDGGTW